MSDRLPVRVTQRVKIARPIADVFEFLRSPENPELERIGVEKALAKGQKAKVVSEPGEDGVRWTIAVTDYEPPEYLRWRSEYRSGGAVIPGACSYELEPNGTGTVVTQTYERPWPFAWYRPFLPLLWWKTRSAMRRRLAEAKELLES